MRVALALFAEYLRIGLLAFGGGLATVPFLFDLAGRRPDWFSASEIMDMLAISEGTPGPIGINMSTYCGYNVMGFLGSLIATFSLVMPAFIVLYAISKCMGFLENGMVKRAFCGLRTAVVALMSLAFLNICSLTFLHFGTSSIFGFGSGNLISLREIVLFAVCFALSGILKRVPPVVFILACGLVTCLFF